MNTKGFWRNVTGGERVSRQFVINHLIESGYKAEHAPSFVDACARSEAFVVVRGEIATFYEFVDLNPITE